MREEKPGPRVSSSRVGIPNGQRLPVFFSGLHDELGELAFAIACPKTEVVVETRGARVGDDRRYVERQRVIRRRIGAAGRPRLDEFAADDGARVVRMGAWKNRSDRRDHIGRLVAEDRYRSGRDECDTGDEQCVLDQGGTATAAVLRVRASHHGTKSPEKRNEGKRNNREQQFVLT